MPRRPVSQRCCGRPAKQTRCVMKHVAVKKRSATGVRASVAHGVDVLLISGGCMSAAPQACREFCWTAACQVRLFRGHLLGAKPNPGDVPTGRNPGLGPARHHGRWRRSAIAPQARQAMHGNASIQHPPHRQGVARSPLVAAFRPRQDAGVRRERRVVRNARCAACAAPVVPTQPGGRTCQAFTPQC